MVDSAHLTMNRFIEIYTIAFSFVLVTVSEGETHFVDSKVKQI